MAEVERSLIILYFMNVRYHLPLTSIVALAGRNVEDDDMGYFAIVRWLYLGPVQYATCRASVARQMSRVPN